MGKAAFFLPSIVLHPFPRHKFHMCFPPPSFRMCHTRGPPTSGRGSTSCTHRTHFEGCATAAFLIAVVVIGFALGPLGGTAQPAYAGPPDAAVLDWNLHAVDALVTASTPGAGQAPPVSVIHLAMVQGTVYDGST